MKIAIHTTLLLLLSSISYGQISEALMRKVIIIGKVGGGMSAFIAELSYVKEANENEYTLIFNNLEYKTITDTKSIKFSGNEETVNQFYSLLQAQFNAEPGTEKELKVGTQILLLKTIKNLGVTSLVLRLTEQGNSGYFYLTEKQLKKLFGKR
jgi:hypothetical protein